MNAGEKASKGSRPRRIWRRLGWMLAGLGLLLAGAVASVDYWLPPAAEAWVGGVSHARRETAAGESVAWERLVWSGEGLRLEAERVRVNSPWRMLWDGKVSGEARGWVLVVAAEDGGLKTEGGQRDGGWPEMISGLRRAGLEMERRVGVVDLRDGVVRFGDEEIVVERLTVKAGGVSAVLLARGQTVELAGDLATGVAGLRWVEGEVGVTAGADASSAKAEVSWAGNTAELHAEFEAGKWSPKTLSVVGEAWRVPAEKLGLGEAYEELRGGFELRREGDGLTATVDARARPRGDGLPELRILLSGKGGLDFARVDRLEIEAPQAKARLSAPLEWRRGRGWSGEGEPVFAWEAELAALSGGVVSGRAEGLARWVMAAEGARVRWEARGTGLGWREIAGVDLRAKGESSAEATTLAEAELNASDGSRLDARGRMLHATRTVEAAALKGTMAGGLFTPWLPEGAAVERAEIDFRAAGAWRTPELEGSVHLANAAYGGWAADRIEVRVKGVPGATLRGEIEAERGKARLEARGEAGPETAMVADFFLRRGDGAELRAVKPAAFRWAGGAKRVDSELAGAGKKRLGVEWTEGGAAKAYIQNVDTSWARDWRTAGGVPDLAVRRAELAWRIGAENLIEGEGSFEVAGKAAGGEVWARGAGRLGADGVRVDNLQAGKGPGAGNQQGAGSGEQGARIGDRSAGGGGEILVDGAGVVPWRLRGGAGLAAEPVAGGRWDLRLELRKGATWWDEVAKVAGLVLEGPALSVRLEGEAEAPRGRVELGAERVVLRGEGLPAAGLELRDVRTVAVLARSEFLLERLAATLDGQRVDAEGRLALKAGDWERVRERPFAWLRDHAEARLNVPEAEVAALARYLPTLLAPQGTVTAELRLSPGARLDGRIGLRGAATRPLGNFGVLQEVEAELALEGMAVRIKRMRAMAGGQEVVVTGGATRTAGKMPALDLAVKAERFPLLRKPGLLLRGDLALTVRTADDGRTRLGGEVRLRDSLFLADIRPLLTPGGGAGAAAVRSRPPYFSVDTPPLADWELGLRVRGESFLRLRTPIFEGTGSARFDLTGTLREPRAIGEFWVERGNILFPFATFAVQEGAVRLKANDPYTPALDFRATGRRLGYDLRLELRGTAEAPQLQLGSSPPLEAETVLLMVTAGAAPEQGRGTASGTQRLAAVGAYVGRDLLRTLGVGGADEERLTVSSGEKVSRAGRETYGFDFKLNDRWSLTGEYDEFDAYNAGLKRRFGPRAEAVTAEEPADSAEADDSGQKKEEANDAR